MTPQILFALPQDGAYRKDTLCEHFINYLREVSTSRLIGKMLLGVVTACRANP
jgi:hypothetical protein